MILSKEVQIKIAGRTLSYYKELGYSANTWDLITIPIEHLKRNSHVIVKVKCDLCEKVKELSYSKYNLNVSRYGFYTCGTTCAITKSKKTLINKIGVDNPMKHKGIKEKLITNSIKNNGTDFFVQTEEFKAKAKKTKLEKYGDENYSNKLQAAKTLILNLEQTKKDNQLKYGYDFGFQSEIIKNKIKESKIKSGSQIPDELLSAWQIYKRDVKNETKKVKKQLFDTWDGLDFYDGEYIGDNFKFMHTDRLYPTIDHKISIHYGFLNNMPTETIGGLDNLCITKRCINSSKNNRQNFNLKKLSS